MDLTKEEISLIIKALKESIVEGYESDPEDGWGGCGFGPTDEDIIQNKAIKNLIKKLKPPVPREKKPEAFWRDKKRTDKQTQVLTAFGLKVRGKNRGKCSDEITELLKKYNTNDLEVAYKKYLKDKSEHNYIYDHDTEEWEPDDGSFFEDYWDYDEQPF